MSIITGFKKSNMPKIDKILMSKAMFSFTPADRGICGLHFRVAPIISYQFNSIVYHLQNIIDIDLG